MAETIQDIPTSRQISIEHSFSDFSDRGYFWHFDKTSGDTFLMLNLSKVHKKLGVINIRYKVRRDKNVIYGE